MIRRWGASLIVLLALVLWPSAARSRVERFAVLIGNNVGGKGDVALRYAESDATRMHDVLKDLGGFPPANLVLLRGEDAATVRASIIAVNDRARQAESAPDTQVVFVVYYSGHADAGALHLGGSEIDLLQLEQLVRGSAASFRILILDACRSGALTRVKGGTRAPQLQIRVDGRLAGEGVVFLTASAANEDAQESDALKGSFFTHYLVSGLMGAADDNGDGDVELEEAYQHAYDSTLRATSRTIAGTQHPTFRYELRGQGKITLSSLPRAPSSRGMLDVPAGREVLVLAATADGAVVAEVSEHDSARRISVKPGIYFVRGRGKDDLVEGQVRVGAGETLVVRDDLLTRVAYARLVRKGQSRARLVHGPRAGYRMRTALWEDASPCHGIFAGYAFESEHLSVVPRVTVCRGGFANETVSADTDEVDLEVHLLHVWDLPFLSFELGVSAGGALLHTSFATRGAAPPRTSATGHVGVGAGVTTDVVGGLYVLGELAAQTYFFRQQDGPSPGSSSVAATFALRPLIGIGKHF